MTGFTADVIGMIGTALFIAAFAYANIATSLDKLWFNLANLIGSVLLLASLSVHFNLAAFVLESAWAVIALLGLAGEIRRRKRRARA